MAELSAEKIELFERTNPFKAVVKLAGPCILSSMITLIYNMADTWFVGQTGDELQVAAVSMIFTLYFILSALGNLYGIGGGSLISRLLGAKRYDKVKTASTFAFYAGLVTTALVCFLVFVFAKPILQLLGASSGTYRHCYDYTIWVVVIGGVPTVASLIIGNLLRSEGHARKASTGIAMGGILNMILDPVFIFLFNMGVKGAAIATMISNVASLAYFLIVYRRSKGKTVLSLNIRDFSFDGPIIGQVYLTGLPACLSTILTTVANTVCFNLFSRYSDVEVAAFGVTKKLDMVPMTFCGGISHGVLPLIAYNYASGNHKRLKQVLGRALAIGVTFAGIYLICGRLFNEQMIRFFIDSDGTVSVGMAFLAVECLAAPLSVVVNLLNSTFQGMGKGTAALLFAACRSAGLKVPVAILMNRAVGAIGILWSQVITESVMALIGIVMFVFLLKKAGSPVRQKG